MWFKYKRKIPKQAKTTRKVINTHSLVSQHFIRYQLNLRIVVLGLLFSDAKLREDFAEDFVSADFSCDAAEGAECFAKVLREQVGG